MQMLLLHVKQLLQLPVHMKFSGMQLLLQLIQQWLFHQGSFHNLHNLHRHHSDHPALRRSQT